MERKQRKNKPGRLWKGLGGLLLSLLAMGAVYLTLVLLDVPEDHKEPQWTVQEAAAGPMQAARMTDVSALAQLFGAPLPAIQGKIPEGEARNRSYDGQPVREISLLYDNALIRAVRPASGAPLLVSSDQSVSLRSDLNVLGLPAVLTQKGDGFTLLFSDEWAAYSIFAKAESEEAFLTLLSDLIRILP